MSRDRRRMRASGRVSAGLAAMAIALGTGSLAHAKIAVRYEETKLGELVKTAAHDLDPIIRYVEFNVPAVSNIGVVVKDCDEVNASYDPAAKRLTFCYELVRYLAQNASKLFANVPDVPDDEVGDAFHQGMFYAFGHEVGHAYDYLSGLMDSEDTADKMATYLLWSVKIDEGSAVGGLVFYEIDRADDEEDLWDEHTPDKKRLANLACWSYGANPEATKDLLVAVSERIGGKKGMERRAERCEGEWLQIKRFGDKAVRFKRSEIEQAEKAAK